MSFGLMAQESLMELKEKMAEMEAQQADAQGQADALQGDIEGLQKQIDKLTGWRKGVNGLFGFDWNNSGGWIANPNPDAQSSSLNINLTGYALNDKRLGKM